MKSIILILVFMVSMCPFFSSEAKQTPLVMWHGMGDYSSSNSYFGVSYLRMLVENHIPGIYVKVFVIGGNVISDVIHGYLGNVNHQVDEVCIQIAQDPELQNGYHAMGFSQGGQFLRAVAERCPNPPMKNLISIGGQHQGVFGVPVCNPKFFLCEQLRRFLDTMAYEQFAQDTLIQAQYWHDPLDEERYKEKSGFLAQINNEQEMTESIKENLKKLEKFVLVKFLKDSMVVPRESSWFGFYRPGQDKEVLPMNETDLYIKDKIGLKEMNEAGKLIFLTVDGKHLDMTEEWFLEDIVDVYVKDDSL